MLREEMRVVVVLLVAPVLSPDRSFPNTAPGKSASVTSDSNVEAESSILAPHCGQFRNAVGTVIPEAVKPQLVHVVRVGCAFCEAGGAPVAIGLVSDPGSDRRIEMVDAGDCSLNTTERVGGPES